MTAVQLPLRTAVRTGQRSNQTVRPRPIRLRRRSENADFALGLRRHARQPKRGIRLRGWIPGPSSTGRPSGLRLRSVPHSSAGPSAANRTDPLTLRSTIRSSSCSSSRVVAPERAVSNLPTTAPPNFATANCRSRWQWRTIPSARSSSRPSARPSSRPAPRARLSQLPLPFDHGLPHHIHRVPLFPLQPHRAAKQRNFRSPYHITSPPERRPAPQPPADPPLGRASRTGPPADPCTTKYKACPPPRSSSRWIWYGPGRSGTRAGSASVASTDM